MGKYKDITGQVFGRLTAIELDFEKTAKHSKTYWKCKCECGNETSVALPELRTGKTKSCGCYRKEVAGNVTKKNLIGLKFGRLQVISLYGSKNNHQLWNCQCDCGNICLVRTTDLTSHNTKSCGCLAKEVVQRIHSNDLQGQKFGKLLAKKPTEKRIDNKVIWECQCDCGNICYVQSTHLVSGHTQSCGCIKSSVGEWNIANILKQNNIQFEQEFKFLDLLSEKSYPLRYDFYLPDYNRLIEFDGEQHYRDTGWGHVEETQQRDFLKNKYALSNNIALVRIPYWERDNITLDLILGDKYLVKE